MDIVELERLSIEVLSQSKRLYELIREEKMNQFSKHVEQELKKEVDKELKESVKELHDKVKPKKGRPKKTISLSNDDKDLSLTVDV